MAKQSEQILEEQLIAQLQRMGYQYIVINDEHELLANLKGQLEKHNNISFTGTEFEKVINLLSKGSIFEKSKILRQKQHIVRDNGDNLYFEFLNTEHWCQNQYQVTNQVTQEGTYKNRYDVTILINGLPLVQIELKRRGLELKEAFNQVNRYQRHSFGSHAALYQYVQIFIISNGVNTKYYANNRNQSFKQTFYWTDVENKRLTNILNGFTDAFLEPCHISKMICKYIVLNEAYKIPMVLRPYQFFAVEALIDRVKNSTKNGYIWHTTGSGKTLTSFKASQILMNLPQVHKVVFVVDRKDLDYQTTKEFNSFSDGCIDGTDNTSNLVKQFVGTYLDKKGEAKNSKLIVTTIQKLNTAISKLKYEKKMADLKDKRIIFIFDECHRSQFGETHNRIKEFFNNAQMFGFTGTPIFADNSNKNELGKRTTKDLFEDCLHKYVITDAIKDENVLKFAVEYVGKDKRRDTATEIDIEVEDIDTQELMEDPGRLEKIADYIIARGCKKFCVN
jgi:type I restriction enzyme R subunit